MRFEWAEVVGLSPLQVLVDGDTVPLPFTPETLIDPADLTVGDRVRVEIGRRVVVHGRAFAAGS